MQIPSSRGNPQASDIAVQSALSMLGSASREDLQTTLGFVDSEIAKLFEDRNMLLTGGGVITNTGGTSLSFTANFVLYINSNIAGASPYSVSIGSSPWSFTADGRMAYITITSRSAGTFTLTTDAASLPAVTSADQEVFLIAKRVGTNIELVNNIKLISGQSTAITAFTSATDSTTTGAQATLGTLSTNIVRLTNASLTSFSGIPAGVSGQLLIVENKTGNTLSVFNEDTGVTAANRILTGTSANVSMGPDSTFLFAYDATSSRWMVVGGTGNGSSSVYNYITANDGSTIGDWITYADGSATPVDGTGGSPTSTFAVSTSTAMRGAANFLWTPSGTLGNGFSYTKAIDTSDRGKVLRLSFDYFIASGTYTDNDLTVWFYDVTNSTLIQGTPYQIKKSSLIERFSSEVQVPSTCASMRVIIHAATTAAAYTMRFDDFFFGQQAKLYGSPITDWTSYTPTISNITTSSATGKYRRVGDSMEVNITFTASANATGTIYAAIPSGFTIDTNKLSGGASYDALGVARGQIAGTGWDASVVYQTTSTVSFRSNNTAVNWNDSTPGTWVNGNNVSAIFKVPILGWSSSVVMSSDADTRVVSGKWYNMTTSITTSGPTLVWASKTYDTHNAMNLSTGVYTVPVSGYYKISAAIGANTNTTGAVGEGEIMSVKKNGVQTNIIGQFVRQSTGSVPVYITGSGEEYCNAGDTLEITAARSSGASANYTTSGSVNSWLTIERLSGPTQIAASETVAASYSGGAGDSLSGTAILFKCTTKNYDTHGMYNSSTGVITFPVSGKYVISGNFLVGNQATANNQSIRTDIRSSSTADSGGTLVYRNLAYFMNGQNPSTINFKSPVIEAIAGAVYSVQIVSDIGASRSLDSSTFTSNISIVKVG